MQVKLQVGDKFELFAGKGLTNTDGAILEALEEGDFAYNVYLTNMNENEKWLLRKGNIKAKALIEGDFILTLFQFENTPLIFEASFDPFLYKKRNDDRYKNLATKNMMTIIGIESTNNTIQTLRQLSINAKLLDKWKDSWKKAENIPDFSGKYERWFRDLEKRYSVLELWDMATYIGKMGKDYLSLK